MVGMVEITIPSWNVVGCNILFCGKLMYETDGILQCIKILERGMFLNGKDFVTSKAYSLENMKERL